MGSPRSFQYAENNWLLFNNEMKQKQTKLTHGEKTQLVAALWRTRQGRNRLGTRVHWTTNWHRTANTRRINRAANKAGNEGGQVGQMNQ